MSAVPSWSDDGVWAIFDLTPLMQGDLSAYLDQTLDRCSTWFQASGASLFLGSSADGFSLAAQTGLQRGLPADAQIDLGEGVAGIVLASGQPRIVGELEMYPDLADVESRQKSVGSAMVVPLIDPDGDPIGVLNVSRRKGERAFRRLDLEQASAMAAFVTLAVTNARRYEQNRKEIIESSRLKRLAEIGQMTAAVAHEIRNPLTGIRSAAQMIRTYPDTLPDFIGLIEDEVDRLSGLCDEFLEFARPMQIQASPTRLDDPVGRAVRLSTADFEAKGVELRCSLGEDLPTLQLDGRRISQVVLNLLRNALHATPAGRSVAVVVERRQIVVEDHGIGMDETQLARLFSPFYTTKPDGTGLGLATCRTIVEAHGGELRVESAPGKGSRFVVDLSGLK